MSEFLGSRISLISKSDIRYVGTLHEINSTESTVSLENVRSFGTEGRRGGGEIAPSEQVYEYIVFRGSDVKDLRIEEPPAPKEKSQPPAVPDDPAILGARPRPPPAGPSGHGPGPGHQPGPPPPGPPGPGHMGQPPFQQNFYGGPPGPPGPWGPPGHPPFGAMPYPPPPGWMPPGQGFPGGPGGPGGPGMWNPYQFPPGPGAPGAPGAPDAHGASQESKPAPAGRDSGDKNKAPAPAPGPQHGPSADASASASAQGPPPPVESKPSAAKAPAVSDSLKQRDSALDTPSAPKASRAPVAIPFSSPATAARATETTTMTTTQTLVAKPVGSIADATETAKAAVAVAMAQLQGGSSSSGGGGMDNLAKRVNDMRINAANPSRGSPHFHPGRGGRGRGNRYPHPRGKIQVPDSDFDFDESNAKFNKEDAFKEVGAPEAQVESPIAEDSATPSSQAYNKKKSFFDNIGSEAKDRAENGGQRPGGRDWRSAEESRNIETFGEGRVDGYRPRRGRGPGRGRGGYGRGAPRGAPRGGPRNQQFQQKPDQ